MSTDMRESRIAEIGKRANSLRAAGFYSTEEVRWLAEYVWTEKALLIEVELLLINAEELLKKRGANDRDRD